MAQLVGNVTSYTPRVLASWYLGLIICGGLLLLTPLARGNPEQPISPLDAIFTSTSAACVTGLAVRSTPDDFSLFGQMVILVLIQLGGIGIMTVTTFILFNLGTRQELRHRQVVSATLGGHHDANIPTILKSVLVVTFSCEGIGFVILSLRNLFAGDAFGTAIWRGLFHSVSAFCNAGFALHNDSLMSYHDDPVVIFTICALIMTGGLGFPVILDIRRLRRVPWRQWWEKLHVHSKLVIVGNISLLIFGWISFMVLEWDSVVFRDASMGEWFLNSVFFAVTPRTAGFNTVDLQSLTNASLFVTIILMIIGAGACSTGGGLKVTTIMVIFLNAWSGFRGEPRLNVYRRTVPQHIVRKAVATAMLFGALAVIALTALLFVEQSDKPHLSTLVPFEIPPAVIEELAEDATETPSVDDSAGNENQEGNVPKDAPAETPSAEVDDELIETVPDEVVKEVKKQVERANFLEALFEVVSALGTVGLSVNFTSSLSIPGRFIIIALMFFGRLGPISVFSALSQPEKHDRVESATEEPLIG